MSYNRTYTSYIYILIPSANQTWQLKITNFSYMIFPLQPPIDMGFPASHGPTAGLQRVTDECRPDGDACHDWGESTGNA